MFSKWGCIRYLFIVSALPNSKLWSAPAQFREAGRGTGTEAKQYTAVNKAGRKTKKHPKKSVSV